jgi:hypothetical protein
LIDENCIHQPADFYHLLPLAAVTRKPRHLPRSHRAHFAQAHFRNHAFKAGSGNRSGGGPAQIFIHNLDLAPTQISQPLLHRVLELLAFQIVCNLIRRRLTDVENRFTGKVVRGDLFTH